MGEGERVIYLCREEKMGQCGEERHHSKFSRVQDSDEEVPIPDGFRNDNIPNPFGGLAPQAEQADNQMRTTWTDLARQQTIKKKMEGTGTGFSGTKGST